MLATSNEAEWGSNIVQWCGSSNMRLEFLVFFSFSFSRPFVWKDLLQLFYYGKLPIYLLYSYLNLDDNQWPSEIKKKKQVSLLLFLVIVSVCSITIYLSQLDLIYK